MSSVPTLSYFGISGRAQITRMCYYHGDREIKNVFFEQGEFPVKQHIFPLSQVPVIEIENSGYICQSGAIARYAAKINGLYPEDHLKALYVDEVYEVISSLIENSIFYLLPEDQSKEEKRTAFLNRDIARFENFIKLRFTSNSPFLVSNTFTVADIAVFYFIYHHLTHPFIGFTIEQIEQVAPTVIAYYNQIQKEATMEKIHKKSLEFLATLSQTQ